MSFLSKYFGGSRRENRGHPRQWGPIQTCIARDLERYRELFFGACVRYLGKRPNEQNVHGFKDALAGSVDLPIRAFQLLVVAHMLARNTYVFPSQGNDFADLLWAQVCGTKVYEAMKYFEKYHEAGSDRVKMVELCGLDIIPRVVGASASPPDDLGVRITDQIVMLLVSAELAVASAFGDKEWIERLQTTVQEFVTAGSTQDS